MKKKTEKYNIDNYVLEYEARGLKPLIQELMYESYYQNKVLMVFRKNTLKCLIPKATWKKMGEKGLDILIHPKQEFFNIKIQNIKRQKKKLFKLSNSKIFTKGDISTFLNTLKSIAKSYGYFNVAYFEKAHELLNSNLLIKENLNKVEKVKNKVKDDFSKAFFFSDSYWSSFLKKISKQFYVNEEDLRWYLREDLLDLFNKKYLSQKNIKERKIAYLFYKNKGIKSFLQGKRAQRFIENFEDTSEEKNNLDIRGTVANISQKKVIAKVKIINIAYDDFDKTKTKIEKMKQGEILVSHTTDPSLIKALKKASAIITDVGGMLSHAAITSRELNISCIVGTKVATKVLKDGDLVEVDAKRGIVRKL